MFCRTCAWLLSLNGVAVLITHSQFICGATFFFVFLRLLFYFAPTSATYVPSLWRTCYPRNLGSNIQWPSGLLGPVLRTVPLERYQKNCVCWHVVRCLGGVGRGTRLERSRNPTVGAAPGRGGRHGDLAGQSAERHGGSGLLGQEAVAWRWRWACGSVSLAVCGL